MERPRCGGCGGAVRKGVLWSFRGGGIRFGGLRRAGGCIGLLPGGGGLVDSPDGFFSVPGCANLPAGVSCLEEAGQSLPAVVVEPFAGEGEEFAYPVEVVVFLPRRPRFLLARGGVPGPNIGWPAGRRGTGRRPGRPGAAPGCRRTGRLRTDRGRPILCFPATRPVVPAATGRLL